MNKKIVSWFSAGVSSFIATYLMVDKIDEIIYIDIDDQHPDSMRFVLECEKILNKKITIIKSIFNNVNSACLSASFIKRQATGYAICTDYLKKRLRKEYEYQNNDYELTYIWGMDLTEKKRAERLVINNSNQKHIFPLIENELTKQDVHAICEKLGVKRPLMYDLGYSNNNCIGCVKGGMGYWNKIRVDFPDVFKQRSQMERTLNCRILKECYLDELEPNRGRMSDEIPTDCSLFCMEFMG